MNQEEAQCAAFIDSLSEVESWVRNLERDQYAFWLPTPTDKFYPDFVAKLNDGRFLVVEYKGSDRTPERDTDSSETQTLGEQWAARSRGRWVFRVVTKQNLQEALLASVRL